MNRKPFPLLTQPRLIMKSKSIAQIIGLSLACWSTMTSVLAQGTVNFNNRVGGVVVAPVYGPEPGNETLAKHGNTATGTPAGSTVYGGALLSGTSYTAELWGGPQGTPEASLSVQARTVFRTGASAGYVVAPASVALGGVAPGTPATLQVRVWDNQGGTISTWDMARGLGVASGVSLLFDSPPLASSMEPTVNLTGLRSFNIHLPSSPPVITCAGDKTVECGSAWSFDTPTATASCGGTNVTLTVLTTVTNGFCPKRLTRIWQATDACANSVQCSQTVTMVDTTPPVLSAVPPGTTVSCLSDVGPIPTVTASDNCNGTNVILHMTTSTNGLFPRLFTRTWTATDSCGNTATASQIFTIPGTILPSAILGLPYDVTLTFPCGLASPDTVGLVGGALPPGLNLSNTTSIRIGGTPKAPGTFRFTIFVTDPIRRTLDYEITVNADCLLDAYPPLVCWKGEGTPDDMTGLHPCVWSGTPAYDGGKVGSAFRFDGTNFLRVAVSDVLSPGATSGAMTLEAWVNPALVSGPVVTKGVGTQTEYSLMFNPTNGQVEFTVGIHDPTLFPPLPGPQLLTVSGGVTPSNYWHHLAGVYAPNGEMVLYVNGARVGAMATPPLPLVPAKIAAPLYIGRRAGISPLLFRGRVDEVCLYSVALDDVTIQRIYLAGSAGKCPPATCIPPPPDLVAWWPGNGNASDIVAGHDGTPRNGASFAAGEVGQAFLLDGVSQSVEVPSAPAVSFAPSSPMSVALWAYRAGGGNVMHLLGKRTGCGGGTTDINYQLAFNMDSGEGVTFGGGFGNGAASRLDLPMNTWTHLAGTFDGATFRLYINGELSAASPGTLGPENTAPLRLGGSGDCTPFAGRLDEVSLYSRALTTTEIQLQYAAASHGLCVPTCTPVPSGLLAWWRGEGDAQDATGLYPGTYHGTNFTAGKVGRAFYLLGYNWVSCGTNVGNFGSNDFTVEFWMWTTNSSQGVLGKRVTCQHGSFWDVRMTNGFLVAELDDNGAGYVHLTASRFLEDGLFHHVALVRQSTTVALFVDGVLEASTTAPVAVVANASPLELGRTPCAAVNEGPFFGILDEVTLYTRALSAAEIQAIHAAGSLGKCPQTPCSLPADLVAWWPGEGNANELIGQHNGTVASGVSFVPGPVGTAFNFDGTGGQVSLPHFSGLDFGPTDSFTTEAWLKPTTAATVANDYMAAISLVFHCSAEAIQLAINSSGQAAFVIRYSSQSGADAWKAVAAISPGSIVDGRWHHVVGVRDAANRTVDLFLDGNRVASRPDVTTGTFTSTAPQHSLGAVAVPCPIKHFWTGGVDEVKVYRRALTPGEIQLEYVTANLANCRPASCVQPASGLVAWWRAEGNGWDETGLHSGVPANGAGFAAGESGQAFSLSNWNQYVSIPYAPALFSLAQGTLEMWVRIPDATANEVILFSLAKTGGGPGTPGWHEWSLGYRGAGAGGASFLQVGAGNGLASFYAYTNTPGIHTPTNTITDTNWHHVAVVSEGPSNLAVYVDGIVQPLAISAGVPAADVGFFSAAIGVDNMLIHGLLRDDLWPYNGAAVVDEIAIYNRPLSAAEIQAIYMAGSLGKCHGDSDGDGLPDAWEIANGLNPYDPADASADSDGDGMTNLQEYLAGTNPQDASSVLRITEVSFDSDGPTVNNLHFTFQAQANKSYSLFQAATLDNLNPDIWRKFRDVPAAPTNRVLHLFLQSELSQTFIRVTTP